jgi:hypothetical protein
VLCVAQTSVEFHKSLPVSSTEPVVLSVEVPTGDVDILYNHEGQVSISETVRVAGDSRVDDTYFSASLAVEQSGNRVNVRQISNAAYSQVKIKCRFRIDVPFRTEVRSTVREGKQTIRGILGPVEAHTDRGEVKVSYVAKQVLAEVGSGSLDIQVVGEHVEAKVRTGNISGERLPQGITAETDDGDITLAVVGPSTARVKKGTGRVDVGGARALLTATTDAGDLHVQAVPHDDWKLNSASGTIRLELPPTATFELDASTASGQLQIERDDLSKPLNDQRQIEQPANGGGKRISAHTESGRIIIR